MKKTQIYAMLLAAAMTAGLLGGCGSTGTTTATKADESAAATESAETTAAESTEATAEASAETTDYEPYEWPLPLTTDGTTFTVSMMINPQLSSYYSGYEDNPSWQEYSKETGVNFEFQNISAMNMSDQYKLMFASQDYPDIMHSGLTFYTSGADAAVDDGVFVDLAPYLEEDAPNYLYWVNKQDGWANITTDEGYRPGFVHIKDEASITKSGPVIRGDWLDALGLDAPETIDELHDALLQMYTTYGGQAEFDSTGGGFAGAWDLNITIQSFPTASYPLYQIDGQVVYGPMQDATKDYLTTMKQWIDEGILYTDFATRTSNQNAIADFGKGVFSYYNADTDALVTQDSYYTTDGGYMAVLPYAVQNVGDKIPFDSYGTTMGSLTSQGTFSITTSCKDVDLAVKVLDWRYSDAGSFLFNYGIEGLTFNYDADGNPVYTDLIVNNPDGLSASWLTAVYMDEYGYVEKYTKFDSQLTDEQKSAREVWAQNCERDYNLPDAISLTAEESEEFSSIMADISTYTQESILKMLSGEMSIDDFPTFQQTLKDMNVDRCIEIYQTAYDRYLKRA